MESFKHKLKEDGKRASFVAELVHSVAQTPSEDSEDTAIDMIYAFCEDLRSSGNYTAIGQFLMQLSVVKLPVTCILAPMTYCCTFSNKVPLYNVYYTLAKVELENRNTPEIEALLQGLAP